MQLRQYTNSDCKVAFGPRSTSMRLAKRASEVRKNCGQRLTHGHCGKRSSAKDQSIPSAPKVPSSPASQRDKVVLRFVGRKAGRTRLPSFFSCPNRPR
jgi:hypothetical protein